MSNFNVIKKAEVVRFLNEGNLINTLGGKHYVLDKNNLVDTLGQISKATYAKLDLITVKVHCREYQAAAGTNEDYEANYRMYRDEAETERRKSLKKISNPCWSWIAQELKTENFKITYGEITSDCDRYSDEERGEIMLDDVKYKYYYVHKTSYRKLEIL